MLDIATSKVNRIMNADDICVANRNVLKYNDAAKPAKGYGYWSKRSDRSITRSAVHVALIY